MQALTGAMRVAGMAAGAQARRGALPRAGPLQLVPRSSLLLAVLCCTVLPVLETRSSAPPDLPRSYSAFGGLASLASVRTPHAGFSRALWEKAATVLRAVLVAAPGCVHLCAAPWPPLTCCVLRSAHALVQQPSSPNVTVSPPLLDFKRRL